MCVCVKFSRGEVGVVNPMVNRHLQLVEIGTQGGVARWSEGGDARQARPQDARVDPGEEQGGA